MKKKTIRTLIICIAVVPCPLIIYGGLCAAMYIAGFLQIDKNIEYQNEHLEYLRTEYYTEAYTPCEEQKMADFDLKDAFSTGVRINEIAVIGTHNSYQFLATPQKLMLERVRRFLSSGKKGGNAEFEMDTYTEQLERGVRNLEIDVETVDKDGEVTFIVAHKPISDNASSAYDFAKGLEEIALWSDNNPEHLPVYLLIEPKANVPSLNNMKDFSARYALALDNTIREVLGDRLLTPKQAMGDYDSLKEMRLDNGWPELGEAVGKIIVLLHPCDVTQEYIDADSSLSSQAMFPMLRFEDVDKSYASFILENEPEAAIENHGKTVAENNLMVRTRADNYPNFSEEKYALADKCGSHIITTDYPPRTVRENEHTYTFGGYTVKLLK